MPVNPPTPRYAETNPQAKVVVLAYDDGAGNLVVVDPDHPIPTPGGAKSVAYSIASDGVLIPVDSLAKSFSGSPEANSSFFISLVYLGNNYKKTLVYDSDGALASSSQWVLQ